MLASQIVARLKREYPKWDRLDLLDVINEIQSIMLRESSGYNSYRSTSTGKTYALTTTAGVYEYEITGAQRIDSVKDESDNAIKYKETPKIGSTDAKITLYEDPNGSVYYVDYLEDTDTITSSSVINIPNTYTREFVEGCEGWIDEREHGLSEKWLKWETKTLPKFYYSMNTNKVLFSKGAFNATNDNSSDYGR